MKLTLAEMQTRAATDPKLHLVSCTKASNRIDPVTNEDIFSIVFDTHPANYKLDCDPVEEAPGEIWAVLEDLDAN